MEDRAGIHNIRIEGSYAKGSRYLREADQLMLKLRSMLAAQGVESGGLHGRFADDVYAYARVAMGVAVVNIVADLDEEEDQEVESVDARRVQTPDFLSGFVYGGDIISGTGPDGETLRVLRDFRPDARTQRLFDMRPDRADSARLAVLPSPELEDELRNRNGPRVFSQYVKLAASMYSGTMKELVQTLMGYGRFAETGIYGELIDLASGQRAQYTPDYLADTLKNGTRIRYDWRWFRTHGLTRAADGRWWVVEVRQGRGVHAMPLQLYAETTTERFRERVAEVGDEAGLATIDLFGGFPTGEGFPTGAEEFDSLVRAGLIVQGASADAVQPFYDHFAYSPYMGWAFSESGARAINTAWRRDEDTFQTGVVYDMRLQIGVQDEVSPSGRAEALKQHVLRASDAAGFRRRIRGVLFKIDRMRADEIDPLLQLPSSVAFSIIDARVAQPIAQFDALVELVRSGRMYAPRRDTLQIKFYDPGIGGLLSHDMTAGIGDRPDAPVTNTTLHAFFLGESPAYVNAFIRPFAPTIVNDEEFGELECGLVGDYTKVSQIGFQTSANGVYTETYDDRQEIVESSITTIVKGRRIGPVLVQFGDDPIFPPRSGVSRFWAFTIETTTLSAGQTITETAAAIPQYTREGYYWAVRRIRLGKSRTVGTNIPLVPDAYSYTGWRNFPGWTGFLPGGCGVDAPNFPSCWTLGDHPAGCGKVTDRHIWEEFYDDSECAALTDNGPWASICQQIEPLVYSSIPPSIPGISVNDPDDSELEVYFVSNSSLSPMRTYEEKRSGSENVQTIGNDWFIPSPTPNGFIHFIFAWQTEAGTASTIKFSSTINTSADQIRGAPTFPDMPEELTNFVGVING